MFWYFDFRAAFEAERFNANGDSTVRWRNYKFTAPARRCVTACGPNHRLKFLSFLSCFTTILKAVYSVYCSPFLAPSLRSLYKNMLSQNKRVNLIFLVITRIPKKSLLTITSLKHQLFTNNFPLVPLVP